MLCSGLFYLKPMQKIHNSSIVEPAENPAEKHPQKVNTKSNDTGFFRPNQSKIDPTM